MASRCNRGAFLGTINSHETPRSFFTSAFYTAASDSKNVCTLACIADRTAITLAWAVE